MKRSRIKCRTVIIIACIMLLIGLNGYAQDAVSRAEVEFVAGTGPTSPVHPEYPDVDGNGEPVEGSLAIVSISHFDFGIIPVAATTQLFDIATTMPNIQVVDLRGTATGWNISAAVSRFAGSSGDSLPGAAIHIIDGRPNSVSAVPAPTQAPNALLTTDGAQTPLVTAKNGAGTGLWVMRWYPPADEGQYIKLEIPAGSATIGNHTATINWILGNTP